MSDHSPTFSGRAAMSLALFGYVPFVALTLALFMSPLAGHFPLLLVALKSYAAIILSFLGGIRWGFATKDEAPSAVRDLALSVVPSLWAWAAFLIPSPLAGFILFAAGFALTGLWDWHVVKNGGAPGWFGQLRVVLTALVAPTMVLAAVAVAVQ